MDNNVIQEVEEPLDEDRNQNIVNNESAEKFQKFICELFEKNGILNDLRTYLRRHIVTVLKSAEADNTLVCNQNYTQRLELTFQALNILIAEYLLRLEFSYTLSVFVSEMPLANMVFDLAKSLMGSKIHEASDIFFTDNDVWSILNYLGVQCDSEHASQILKMYRHRDQPSLLLCILKCLPMYRKGSAEAVCDVSSEESLRIQKSCEVLSNKNHAKCPHLTHCKMCQNYVLKIKDKYKRKKKYFCKMFQQLKSVYEAEVEMVKVEEDKKVKRSMASHALQLQKQKDELEESYKARKAELEHNVAEKKKFLWGLARALREQHHHMTRAMHEVHAETQRLSSKEDQLKVRLEEAERMIKQRAEEMRTQISEELAALDQHLTSIKNERDTINKERSDLEALRIIENHASRVIKVHDMENESMQSHYDLIKKELVTLKKYFEASKFNPKSVTEKGTVTDLRNVTSRLNVCLNNNQHAEKYKSDEFEDRLKNQVVNDFKKKNVNFTPSKVDELYRENSYVHTQSSGSSEVGDPAHISQPQRSDAAESDALLRLQEENARLKECARQQQLRIEALSCACAGLRPRPSAASRLELPTVSTPTPCQPQYFLHSVNTCASANTVSMSWYKGAGEELSVFSDAQPRILVPGDNIPFVGVLRDRERHVGYRRQLLSQWRALRPRQHSQARVSKRTPSPNRDKVGSSSKQSALALQLDNSEPVNVVRDKPERLRPPALEMSRNREKSPKSVLREAKENLRNIKELNLSAREKNSNAILREAKLRLRKLEIEAEAAEKSYLDFRRRQQVKGERNARVGYKDDTLKSVLVDRNLNANGTRQNKPNIPSGKIDAPLTDYQKTIRSDFDKYLREYQTSLTIGGTHFKQHANADFKKPIPETYLVVPTKDNEGKNNDYLETPLTEFRKLYRSNRHVDDGENGDKIFNHDEFKSSIDENIPECSTSKQPTTIPAQVQSILKKNIDKVRELSPDVDEEPESGHATTNADDENLLRVEVESLTGVHAASNELVLVVQNTINIQEVEQNSIINNPGQQTIVVGPVESLHTPIEDIDVDIDFKRPIITKKSLSPEQEANLTRNDVLEAIFNTNPETYKAQTVVETVSKDMSGSVSDKNEEVDDYSADVDNYVSHFSSPVSIHKTSDDHLWDS